MRSRPGCPHLPGVRLASRRQRHGHHHARGHRSPSRGRQRQRGTAASNPDGRAEFQRFSFSEPSDGAKGPEVRGRSPRPLCRPSPFDLPHASLFFERPCELSWP
ncbi:hypothetical protein AAFF_G00293110 [Aldrovandia affinis]|uniref:Uncharacterized protein n=1 Tax=Aldrovandia affinis TaxID=143900 RepID=A0AAD7SR16_9TELE|nr:hypothetical protein AAFF_G00293110 [Aldrovandia affinis]